MAKDTQVGQDTVAPYGLKLRHGIIRTTVIDKDDFGTGQLTQDSGNFLTQGTDIRSLVQNSRDYGDNGAIFHPIPCHAGCHQR
ncbi:hypothetical protein Gxy13693_022_043 [Komagataeibacter xylinus NBRC 13693]|uniref:Uncharacterized protein n=1 Tax=Komagataeibacter xylinus NBRC 13693 TaxID=1234668 RepID=A0A0D6Q8Y3_KOMXY|nr:hypothetical protein Gxy13693_022_043 [Komagataeibacter xylinus NBRC 13693]